MMYWKIFKNLLYDDYKVNTENQENTKTQHIPILNLTTKGADNEILGTNTVERR